MHNLMRVIGKAPSEMTFEELQAKLSTERDRIRTEIENFRSGKIKARGGRKNTPKKTKHKKKLVDAAKVLGLSPDKVAEIITKAKMKGERK